MIERIVMLMKERGLNGKQLAEEIGIAKNAISEWKSGRIKPSTDVVIKIADYFGVSCDYLLTGKEFFDKINTEQDSDD